MRATPTMTPEESMIWEAEQAAIPVVLKQAKPSRSAGWTPEMRAAAGERSRNRRRAAPFGLAVSESSNGRTAGLGPANEGSTPSSEATPSLSGSTPQEAQLHTTHVTPEEAAHEDAAIILAPDPSVHRHPFIDHTPKPGSTVLPDCTCPPGWWDVPRGSGMPRIPSSKHEGACPLHRHRWKLPSASSDGEGGRYTGVCECGATKLHEPFGAEDNRAAVKREQTAAAGLKGAAARHTAAVSA